MTTNIVRQRAWEHYSAPGSATTMNKMNELSVLTEPAGEQEANTVINSIGMGYELV